eukprot:365224-Chlamydomonas_euryale.AAC.15
MTGQCLHERAEHRVYPLAPRVERRANALGPHSLPRGTSVGGPKPRCPDWVHAMDDNRQTFLPLVHHNQAVDRAGITLGVRIEAAAIYPATHTNKQEHV